MTQYTYRLIESHKVDLVRSLTFDTTDQVEWERLLSLVDPQNLADDAPINDFPAQAPNDVDTWLELLRCIDESEIGAQEADWWQMNLGGYETNDELLDSSGKLVDTEIT